MVHPTNVCLVKICPFSRYKVVVVVAKLERERHTCLAKAKYIYASILGFFFLKEVFNILPCAQLKLSKRQCGNCPSSH